MTAGGGDAGSGTGVAAAARTTGEGAGVGVGGDGAGEADGAGDGVVAGNVRAGSCFGSGGAAGTAEPAYGPATPSGEAPLPAAKEAAMSPVNAQTSVTPSATSHTFALLRPVFTIPQQLQQR